MKIVTTPTHDSDNTNPPEVMLTPLAGQATIVVSLEDPKRTITLSAEDLAVAVRIACGEETKR